MTLKKRMILLMKVNDTFIAFSSFQCCFCSFSPLNEIFFTSFTVNFLDYARELGIDPDSEPELMQLAREHLRQHLLPGREKR